MHGLYVFNLCSAVFFPVNILTSHIMELKQEELIEREIEIAGYLLHNLSIKLICEKTALSKKHLSAHISNMMKKLKAEDMEGLMKVLRIMKP